MIGEAVEITAIIMITAELVTVHLANYVNKHSLIHVRKSLLKAEDKNIPVLTIKTAQVLRAYQGKVKQHKPVRKNLVLTLQVKVVTQESLLHQKMLAFAIVQAPLLVALDVANNEKRSRKYYEYIV